MIFLLKIFENNFFSKQLLFAQMIQDLQWKFGTSIGDSKHLLEIQDLY